MKKTIFILVLVGILFQLISGGIMLKNALMADKDIKDVSATYWDSNRYLESQLLKERKSAWFSLSFLILGTSCLVVAHFLQEKRDRL